MICPRRQMTILAFEAAAQACLGAELWTLLKALQVSAGIGNALAIEGSMKFLNGVAIFGLRDRRRERRARQTHPQRRDGGRRHHRARTLELTAALYPDNMRRVASRECYLKQHIFKEA